jgi:hypothetical protein
MNEGRGERGLWSLIILPQATDSDSLEIPSLDIPKVQIPVDTIFFA